MSRATPSRYDGNGYDPPYNTDTDVVASMQEEIDGLRALLTAALPRVEASAGAQHLLDGFRPQVRLVQTIREALQ